MIIETERLILREMTQDDLDSLGEILQDEETMVAYEGALTEEETRKWLDWQRTLYREKGYGLWAVILKENKKMIGQCGLTMKTGKTKGCSKSGISSTGVIGTKAMRRKSRKPARNTLSKS